MSKYLLKKYLDEISTFNTIKANEESYESLLTLLSKEVTSYYVPSFSHEKIVAFFCTIISDPKLTDKLITAISSYNDKEALGVLDG
jgi:hypothetical protein